MTLGVRSLLRPRTSWLVTPVGAALALLILLGTVTLGLRFRSATDLALPPAAALDYGSWPFGAISPLSASYIDAILGGTDVHREPARAGAITGSTVPADLAFPPRVEVEHQLTNDDRSQAWSIPSVPFTARTDTREATRESGEPAACGAPTGGSVWYSYTPSDDTALIANTFGSNYATTLAIFTGGTSQGCDTDVRGNALVQLAARGGVTYLFQIAGPAGGGDLVFSLDPDGVTTLESLSPTGEPADAPAVSPSISGDGRFVAFMSTATNIVPGAACQSAPSTVTNDHRCWQIFVRDRARGSTRLVSVSSSGKKGDRASYDPYLSGDGRYVTFYSDATNLVDGDTNDASDVFVHDLSTGETERVSVSSSGEQSKLEPPTEWETSAADRSVDNHASEEAMFATISHDGRYVAFQSRAHNLVAHDYNHTLDVFVHDRLRHTTERVSVSSAGVERGPDTFESKGPKGDAMTPSISGDGRFVAFRTSAANLVEGDDNQSHGTFIHDRLTRRTERVTGPGEQLHLEDDGQPRYTQTEGRSFSGLSFDGRYVTFSAYARSVDAPADANVFVHDRRTGRFVQASVSSTGEKAEDGTQSRLPSISADGRYVVFQSQAENLVPEDENGMIDVFVHDVWTRTTVRLASVVEPDEASEPACRRPKEAPPCGSLLPSISADGRHVAFMSTVGGFLLAGTSDQEQVYVHTRPPVR